MNHRGIVENGVIRPNEPLDLPDGTEVAFEPIKATPGMSLDEASARTLKHDRGENEALQAILRRTGVKPVNDTRDLAGDWPPEDDIDDFIKSLREWRR